VTSSQEHDLSATLPENMYSDLSQSSLSLKSALKYLALSLELLDCHVVVSDGLHALEPVLNV